MIITLKGANFSQSNIGTLSTYSIRFDSNGITNTNTSVDRENNTGYTATITFKENYELNGAITVTMGGIDITSTAVSGHTITITKVTGNVVIKVPTKSTVIEPETPVTPTNYTFTLNPDPDTATVTLSATGYSTVSGTGSQSITVANGTTVNWRVEASGYTEQNGTWTANGNDESKDVKLTVSSGDDENTTIRYALAPKNMVTGKLVNKTTGASEESSSSRYNEYTVDAAWTLYADGYNANKTAKSGGVTYFDAADAYLGYDALGEDSYGVEFEGELLTVPAGTATVKVLSSVGKIDPALYRETVGTWTAITKDSTVVGKVTNKETGALEDSSGGRYTSYTVEDSWILCADGYASSKSAAVSYFDASGNYLGYDSLGGLSSVVFKKVTLNVPSGTTTIRVQAAAANQSMALYRLV